MVILLSFRHGLRLHDPWHFGHPLTRENLRATQIMVDKLEGLLFIVGTAHKLNFPHAISRTGFMKPTTSAWLTPG